MREREILDLIADGCTNRQIGERLFLAEKTVKNYVSGLLTKLGMQRRTQAACMEQPCVGRRAGSLWEAPESRVWFGPARVASDLRLSMLRRTRIRLDV